MVCGRPSAQRRAASFPAWRSCRSWHPRDGGRGSGGRSTQDAGTPSPKPTASLPPRRSRRSTAGHGRPEGLPDGGAFCRSLAGREVASRQRCVLPLSRPHQRRTPHRKQVDWPPDLSRVQICTAALARQRSGVRVPAGPRVPWYAESDSPSDGGGAAGSAQMKQFLFHRVPPRCRAASARGAGGDHGRGGGLQPGSPGRQRMGLRGRPAPRQHGNRGSRRPGRGSHRGGPVSASGQAGRGLLDHPGARSRRRRRVGPPGHAGLPPAIEVRTFQDESED